MAFILSAKANDSRQKKIKWRIKPCEWTKLPALLDVSRFSIHRAYMLCMYVSLCVFSCISIFCSFSFWLFLLPNKRQKYVHLRHSSRICAVYMYPHEYFSQNCDAGTKERENRKNCSRSSNDNDAITGKSNWQCYCQPKCHTDSEICWILFLLSSSSSSSIYSACSTLFVYV